MANPTDREEVRGGLSQEKRQKVMAQPVEQAEVRGDYYNTVNTEENINRIEITNKSGKKMMAIDEPE